MSDAILAFCAGFIAAAALSALLRRRREDTLVECTFRGGPVDGHMMPVPSDCAELEVTPVIEGRHIAPVTYIRVSDTVLEYRP